MVLVPKINKIKIYTYLLNEGVFCCKKDYQAKNENLRAINVNTIDHHCAHICIVHKPHIHPTIPTLILNRPQQSRVLLSGSFSFYFLSRVEYQ